ncbi:hypothetical protein BDR05DRAFT_881287, partial [Suillus weaverae]
TSTGMHELYSFICEETALGAQLQCNTCKESMKMKKANDKNIPEDAEDGYCFATTSTAYWSSWEHWWIPCEFCTLDVWRSTYQMNR